MNGYSSGLNAGSSGGGNGGGEYEEQPSQSSQSGSSLDESMSAGSIIWNNTDALPSARSTQIIH